MPTLTDTTNPVLWSTLLLSYSRDNFNRYYAAGTINQWELSFITNIYSLISDNPRFRPSERQKNKLREVLKKLAPTVSIYFDTPSFDVLASGLSETGTARVSFDATEPQRFRRRDPNDQIDAMSYAVHCMGQWQSQREGIAQIQCEAEEVQHEDADAASIEDVFLALSTTERRLTAVNTANTKFGIEIEVAGISRKTMANAVAGLFHTRSNYEGGSYDCYTVTIEDKKWEFKSDASIETVNNVYKGCEIISPPLYTKDLAVLRKIIRCAKANGAKAHKSCGIHVHIDGANFKQAELIFLLHNYLNLEDCLYKILGITASSRLDRYAKKFPRSFRNRVLQLTPSNRFPMPRLKELWYTELGSSVSSSSSHYNSTRYHGLNLHSYFNHGTVEFRLFNASLNCSKIQAYIMLCLFLAVNALNKDLVYPPVLVDDVSPSFMQERFKEIIGMPFRDWVAPDAQQIMYDEFKSLVYRLE